MERHYTQQKAFRSYKMATLEPPLFVEDNKKTFFSCYGGSRQFPTETNSRVFAPYVRTHEAERGCGSQELVFSG